MDVRAGNRPGLAAVALAMLVSCPPPAVAQSQQLASAGLWTAFAATRPDQRPVCGMATTGADGRQIAVEQAAGETGLHIVLEKPSWAIPDGINVDVTFQFDNGPEAGERASGRGTRLTVELPFERSVNFMRGLRRGSQIKVHFPNGNEPFWAGGLNGSSAMMDAFNDCRSRFTGAPPAGPSQPFAPATAAQPHG